MKAKNSKQWGYKGRTEQENKAIAKGKRGKVFGLCNTIPNTSDGTKYARNHLSLDEYLKKIRFYTRRAKERKPLFDCSSEKHPEEDYRNTYCAGCGKKAEKRSYLQSFGWVREHIRFNGELMGRLTVMWCPVCYQEDLQWRKILEVILSLHPTLQ